MKIKYFFRVLSGATFGKMKTVVKRVHEKSGKNKILVFFDIIGCAIKYGAGYNDYLIFEFYNMKAAQRKTYMTRMKNKKFDMLCNDQKYTYIFDNKNIFDKRFAKYLGRETLDLAEADYERFAQFAKGKDVFFAKPNVGESGKGIEKLRAEDFADTQALWAYVTDKGKNFGVIEEALQQHEDAAKIYPCSMNCLRVATLVKDGKVHILYAVFKTGNNGNFVDNLENGGLACSFDLDTGTVTGRGHSSALELYDAHPYTGISFVGYQLPFHEEIKELVCQAAMEVPEMRYVGWDVCFTRNGPAIIEGNDYPAYDFPQLPEADKPRVGFLHTVQQVMPEFK